jgi:hypothetical protein
MIVLEAVDRQNKKVSAVGPSALGRTGHLTSGIIVRSHYSSGVAGKVSVKGWALSADEIRPVKQHGLQAALRHFAFICISHHLGFASG